MQNIFSRTSTTNATNIGRREVSVNIGPSPRPSPRLAGRGGIFSACLEIHAPSEPDRLCAMRLTNPNAPKSLSEKSEASCFCAKACLARLDNPPGGGAFGCALRWLIPHSPLRGCSELAASLTAKIPSRRPSPIFQTDSKQVRVYSCLQPAYAELPSSLGYDATSRRGKPGLQLNRSGLDNQSTQS